MQLAAGVVRNMLVIWDGMDVVQKNVIKNQKGNDEKNIKKDYINERVETN